MTATTQTILATTIYGVPSGNYDGSSQEWSSDPVRAADYYRGYGGVQTIGFRTTDFEGLLHLEASLDSDPDSAAWFETFVFGDGSTTPLTDYYPATITGNFTWMRVRVSGFSGGTVESVNITY